MIMYYRTKCSVVNKVQESKVHKVYYLNELFFSIEVESLSKVYIAVW